MVKFFFFLDEDDEFSWFDDEDNEGEMNVNVFSQDLTEWIY